MPGNEILGNTDFKGVHARIGAIQRKCRRQIKAVKGKPEGCEVPDVSSVECGWGSNQDSREVPEAYCRRQLAGHWGPWESNIHRVLARVRRRVEAADVDPVRLTLCLAPALKLRFVKAS